MLEYGAVDAASSIKQRQTSQVQAPLLRAPCQLASIHKEALRVTTE